MALRTSQLPNLIGAERAPKKVETKLVQGPILQRAALGEVGNRIVPLGGNRAALKRNEIVKKQSLVSKPAKPKSTISASVTRVPSKENTVKTNDVVEELMDVEEEAEVEELSIAFSTQCLNVEDIDADDVGNPQLVSEYVNDIYRYLHVLEENNKVRPRYLEGQMITGKMRTILVDWLVQVHLRFTLLQETLYLSVAIIDRFLQSDKSITRTELQLVGVTAMFIASKYEEMLCPEIGDFAYITDKAYSKTEIRRMEVRILTELDFNVSFPLPLHFLRRNSKAGSVDASQHTLAKYLMELCLQEYSMCHYKPSIIAAAALCLSLKLLDNIPWNDTLFYYSCYSEDQLMPVICKIAAIVNKSSSTKQHAVRQKYKAVKLMKTSDLPQLKSKILTQLAQRGSST